VTSTGGLTGCFSGCMYRATQKRGYSSADIRWFCRLI